MTYLQKMQQVLTDPSVRDWAKKALIDLSNRDVIDALNDLEMLQDLMVLRFDELKQAWEKRK